MLDFDNIAMQKEYVERRGARFSPDLDTKLVYAIRIFYP
jgi:hypothetical protein